jgi:DNA-binding transcriptional LysR family regulator
MEFKALQIFVEVVRNNGFSRAAAVSSVTQSTVSKIIKQLEHELGAPIIDRVGRRAEPTDFGSVVYRHALKILADRDNMIAEIGDVRGLKQGRLRLGLPPVNTSTLFGPVLARYRDRHPNIEIQLVEQGGEHLKGRVLSGDVDLAVAILPLGDEFQWQEVTHSPLVAILPPEHPLGRREAVDLTDLQHLPFVLFETGYSITRVIVDACKRRGFEPVISAQSSQIALITELAALGFGIGFLPKIVADHLPVNYVVLSEPQTDWRLAIVWRRGAYLSNAARAWLDLVREYGPAG